MNLIDCIGQFLGCVCIIVFLEEDALRACKDAHKWADREVIDGRNSASRKKTFFELCANKNNDTGFHPHFHASLDLHDDFLDNMKFMLFYVARARVSKQS